MPTELYPPPAEAVDIDSLNQEFEPLTPTVRIGRAAKLFAGQLVVASSFGPTAPVLLERVRKIAPDTPVVNIRHHHETLKTLDLISWYEREFDLDLRIYNAPPIPVPLEGTAAFADFRRRVKVEPFQEALEDLNAEAFLSGRMRWQSPERSNLPIVEKKGAVVVINPIADLGQEAVERFFNNPYLPERDKNYFDPAKGDGQLLECGLNTAIYRGRED